MKFFNKRSRLSDLGIPLHTGIKPFPFKLCIEKHRTAETLKPETRNFRPIRKQLLSRKKIASSQKNTCLCIGSGSGTGASVLRPDASFPEPTRRAPAVRKRNPGQRPPREKRQNIAREMLPFLRRSRAQDAKDADFSTGVYQDVHDREKPLVRQGIARWCARLESSSASDEEPAQTPQGVYNDVHD